MSELDFEISKVKIITIPELFGFHPPYGRPEGMTRQDLDEKIESFFLNLYGRMIPCLVLHDDDIDKRNQKIHITDRPRSLSKIVVRASRDGYETRLHIVKQVPTLDLRQKTSLVELIRSTGVVRTHECELVE